MMSREKHGHLGIAEEEREESYDARIEGFAF